MKQNGVTGIFLTASAWCQLIIFKARSSFMCQLLHNFGTWVIKYCWLDTSQLNTQYYILLIHQLLNLLIVWLIVKFIQNKPIMQSEPAINLHRGLLESAR